MDEAVAPEVTLLVLGGTGVLLLLGSALVAFFLIYQRRLIGQQLTLQTLQNAYQKELLTAAIAAEERERERIGSDLHDGLGSSLSAVKLLLTQLERPATPTKTGEVVALIGNLLADSLQDIRHISQNLHPAVLARFGLAEALYHLGQQSTPALPQGLHVVVDLDLALTYDQELALYRIVQELVANALKHAQATRVKVQLQQEPHCLALVVADDGVGFDSAHPPQRQPGGLGLKSLAARVSLLDATLHVDSAPGQGTHVRVEMPLPAAAP